jgi:hypothetical protein
VKISKGIAFCILALVLPGLLTSCAEVKVRKVPTPSQYLAWTDQMQKESDAIDGIRFYLPRPFVNVFESFPVHSDVYLARGVVTPDGRYIAINSIVEIRPDGAGPTIYTTGDKPIVVQKRNVFRPGAATAKALAEGIKQTPSIKSQSTTETGKDTESNSPGDKAKSKTGANGASDQPPEGQPATPSTAGTSSFKVRNLNNAFAFQPLRGNFDLVYLPDFEEQYAITSKSRLGSAKAEVQLGQGWSLQGLDASTDNSKLVDRIFGLIDFAIKTGQEAAKAAIGIPPGVGAIAKPQSAEETLEKDKGQPGTEITLKVTVVHYAAKGLYPVLKARELQPRKIENGTSHMIIDLQGSGAKNSGAASSSGSSQQPVQTAWGRFTIPKYPYQFLSFNAFRFMAIEGMHPDDPFAHLIDKTGTKGDPGDRQVGDLLDLLKSLVAAQDQNPNAQAVSLQDVKPDLQTMQDELNSDLTTDSGAMKDAKVILTPTTVAGGKVSLQAKFDKTVSAADKPVFEKRVRDKFDSFKSSSTKLKNLTLDKVDIP